MVVRGCFGAGVFLSSLTVLVISLLFADFPGASIKGQPWVQFMNF